MNTRSEQIEERRMAMPRKYRSLYDRAVKGKSLRACINAQCLECVYWVSKEVTLCTDLGCPLYAVRPYQDSSGNAREGDLIGVESKKGVQEASG
ncbi:MAG: hypothetical protein JXA81_14950 [Sedimentisphaerales bacterium]|nr:hypothetical protein [Sedimentisphaerales bacterium]